MKLNQGQQEIVEAAEARFSSSPWMSIQDLASQLGVSVRTVRRMHAAGQSPPRVKRSRKFMYHRAAVQAWLAAFPGRTQ